MACNFDPNICSVECKKYPICSYYSLQNQFINLQSQLNFIFNTLTEILKTNEASDRKISLLEEAIRDKINRDSEMRENNKESKYEKDN
jgi:hypothetical protein